MKYVDFYTGATRGELTDEMVDTLLDFIDLSGDGIISTSEFMQLLATDDVMSLYEELDVAHHPPRANIMHSSMSGI